MAHKEFRAKADADHKAKMNRMLDGHTDLADKRADEAMIRTAIREHEDQDHGGKHSKLKFKRGGSVEAEKPKARLDRPGRARGGKTPHKGAHVNVIVAPQVHPGGPGMNAALPVPAAAAPVMPPHPPVAAPMPMPGGGAPGGIAGGPPIGAMPHLPMAPGMAPRKRGGNVSYPIHSGAGGGKARLEKAEAYGKNADKGEGEA